MTASESSHALYPSDPEIWASQLDQYLPKELRSPGSQISGVWFQDDDDINNVMTILSVARGRANVDILEYMGLDQGRYKAVLYLADMLLQPLAGSADDSKINQLPSNIQWPISFTGPEFDPVHLESSSYSWTKSTAWWEKPSDDAIDRQHHEKVMQVILPLLAKLTVAASQLVELEGKGAVRDLSQVEAKRIMRTVHQIAARLHNLGLVPLEMYQYSLPLGTTNVQRPPILHLLSSRILSTVSDAVWRSQQDEAIDRAVQQGLNYQQISQDVPGGRFRLKVRELGPEVWLEFLMWFCVDGGYASAGAQIISVLRCQTDSPWYAVHWCSNHGLETAVPRVDWDKAKTRLGGTAGRLEGYSAEEPFAHIPRQTISAEVVLALVESLFNSLNTQISGSGLSTQKFLSYLLEVLSFLEPHALGPEYFNYLTVRFLQTGSASSEAPPDDLRNWYHVISQARSLETIKSATGRTRSLDLERIAAQTELDAGVLHQALQGYINQSNATKAVNCFTDVQRHVDASRLESIGTFLMSAPQENNGFSPMKEDDRSRLDFLKSHGQLPTYKMAGFLNLVTRARLFGLGQWLLDSVDVDGPLIPESLYGELCMTVSLTKYADATGDDDLIKQVAAAPRRLRRNVSVNALRAITNALISVSDWPNASRFLTQLKDAPGGGYSPKIVARLGAKIIQIESQLRRLKQNKDLSEASALMSDILAGVFDGPRADFTLSVIKTFDQQVGYLLRLFENLPSVKERDIMYIPDAEIGKRAHRPASQLTALAHKFKSKFPLSNDANLAPETFNEVLSAIVQFRGAKEGVRMWHLFCKDPRYSAASEKAPLLGEYIVPEGGTTEGEDDLEYSLYVSRSEEQMPPLMDGHVPIISAEHKESATIPVVGESPDESQSAEGSLNPMVVPNLQTLHIIVRGALAEKRHGQGLMLEKEADLDWVLRWATHFYKALNYSKEDIEAETQLPVSLKGENTSQAQLKWFLQRPGQEAAPSMQEMGKLDIKGMFNAAAPLTRLPGVKRPEMESRLSV
ncbi:uncharacterized protein A1O9_02965 [Exophiala aquamarina CBS 119918]|uniref:Sec39 domain-containing protein n=1 Tax=Exophiala aquamarina CBS 119918 TaxID=1182545 RepID=A0A072PMU5_9EURO|nr:uncharacterized protein A1O9_02965 [Exophiala aquamarina CBS 119918]KEF61399.1 hypothetical protein A1O9_02965 [Exophiala aquamarina CBS 119918]